MKKKRISPAHYMTDALITSDEWDNVLFNLKHELRAFRDKETFDECKERNNALLYLLHAEDTLTAGSHLTSDARAMILELRQAIKHYDAWRVFVQTLCLATTVYRAGLIPQFIARAEGYSKKQSDKASRPRSRGGKTPADIKKRNEEIIEHFKKSRLTASSFAVKYASKYDLKPRRVRDILNVAVGN